MFGQRVRKIVKIDESKCDGCGLCIKKCAEGALKIIDGKARLVSDAYCDGLGACLGHCPKGAITIIERKSEDFNKEAAMRHIENAHTFTGCPGSMMQDFRHKETPERDEPITSRKSQLRQWPVQLHLVSPLAPYFKDADLLLSADCVAYALGDFHKDYLTGKSLAIACPKLDERQDTYVEKIIQLIDIAKINTLTVMIMQVPCCSGLLALAKEAQSSSKRKIPIKCIVVSLQGEVLSEEWV